MFSKGQQSTRGKKQNHISVKAFLIWLLQQMNIWTLMSIWNETAEGAYKVGTPVRKWA